MFFCLIEYKICLETINTVHIADGPNSFKIDIYSIWCVIKGHFLSICGEEIYLLHLSFICVPIKVCRVVLREQQKRLLASFLRFILVCGGEM